MSSSAQRALDVRRPAVALRAGESTSGFRRDRLTWVAFVMLSWFAVLHAAPGLVMGQLRVVLAASFAVMLAPLTVGALADTTSLAFALGSVPILLAAATIGLATIARGNHRHDTRSIDE